MAIDPVCGMTVDEKTAKWKSDFEGKTYYFCAPGCKVTFEENPRHFVGPNARPMSAMEDKPRKE